MLYLGVGKLLEFEPKSQNETRRERSKEDLAITNEVLIRRESAYKREEGKERVPGLSNTGLSNTANFRIKEHNFPGVGIKNTASD